MIALSFRDVIIRTKMPKDSQSLIAFGLRPKTAIVAISYPRVMQVYIYVPLKQYNTIQ